MGAIDCLDEQLSPSSERSWSTCSLRSNLVEALSVRPMTAVGQAWIYRVAIGEVCHIARLTISRLLLALYGYEEIFIDR